MGVRVDIELNEPEIDRFLRSPDGEVVRAVRRVADATRNLAAAKAPVDNGPLRASLRVAMEVTARAVTGWVYSPLEYAPWVHEGTGIYGPQGRPIRPTRGKYLVFEGRNPRTTPRGQGALVFAREVRGMRPRPFLLDALREASPWPVTAQTTWT